VLKKETIMAKQLPYDGTFQEGPASKAIVSLSQVLLAPLDAIFKAQIHAARSFLNMVLQMGYPHLKLDENGQPLPMDQQEPDSDKVYMQEFKIKTTTDDTENVANIRIPALSMIPVAPLSIEQAEFDLDFSIGYVYRNTQIQKSESATVKDERKFSTSDRPWFLVSDPISIRGVVAPAVSHEMKQSSEDTSDTKISIRIKVTRQDMPSGLDKLLTTLNQSSSVSNQSVTAKVNSPDQSR
jgi:hypothetical protein